PSDSCNCFFNSSCRPPPAPHSFPYTTLFRSGQERAVKAEHDKGFIGRYGAGLPAGSDSQLLFMQSAVDKMNEKEGRAAIVSNARSEEQTSELQSRFDLVCRLMLEKKENEKTA